MTEQEKRFAKVFAEFSDYISRDELKAIEKKFISFDTDGNGFIDLMELKIAQEKMGIKKTHLEVKELLEKTATDPSKGITFRDLVRFTLLSKGIQIKDKGTSDPGDIPEKMVIPDIVSTFVKAVEDFNPKKIIAFHEEKARLAKLEREREEEIKRQRELKKSAKWKQIQKEREELERQRREKEEQERIYREKRAQFAKKYAMFDKAKQTSSQPAPKVAAAKKTFSQTQQSAPKKVVWNPQQQKKPEEKKTEIRAEGFSSKRAMFEKKAEQKQEVPKPKPGVKKVVWNPKKAEEKQEEQTVQQQEQQQEEQQQQEVQEEQQQQEEQQYEQQQEEQQYEQQQEEQQYEEQQEEQYEQQQYEQQEEQYEQQQYEQQEEQQYEQQDEPENDDW